MKKIYDRTLEEQIYDNRKKRDKASQAFNKLLARLRKPKNPFDEVRSYTLPITKDIKPGADDD